MFKLDQNPGTIEKALAAKFSTVTNYVSTSGLRDLATYGEDGKLVPTPKYPFNLIFRPRSEINKKFPENYKENYTEQLKKIEPETLLYDVYAIDQPGCDEKLIGYIKLISKLRTSNWGDQFLFFRHQKADIDDEDNDWAQHRDSFSVWSGVTEGVQADRRTDCPFMRLLN
jgi:hypothetical protein